jgi:hypothetical protein
MEKEKLLNKNLRVENEKLNSEVRKLTESLEKFQNHILKQTEYDPTLSRQVSIPAIDPILSRHTSQPQVFTTTMISPVERTPGRNTYAEYYETSMVNNTMMANPLTTQPQLDLSNMSGYKSTSILAPCPTGGNIKVNINHEIFQKESSNGSNSFYSAAVNPAIERSISIGFQQANR